MFSAGGLNLIYLPGCTSSAAFKGKQLWPRVPHVQLCIHQGMRAWCAVRSAKGVLQQ